MKKKILIIIIFLLFTTGCSKIKQIKKGYLNACQEYTIEELINNYMEEPKWTSQKSDKGYYVYNVTGKAYYNNELSNMLIQFAEDGNDIVVKSFEINKVEQNVLLYAALVTSMCDDAKNNTRFGDNTSSSGLQSSILMKMGIKYYEEFYYPSHGENYVSYFKDTGITINLSSLEAANIKDDSNTLSSCNKNTTKITIYPKEPFKTKDYTIETNLDC